MPEIIEGSPFLKNWKGFVEEWQFVFTSMGFILITLAFIKLMRKG